jgi:uncharacterized membrane protein YebE (DUF533 family)
MNKNVKNILVVGGVVVVAYVVGKVVLSSVATAVVIGGVAAAGYFGYQKLKNLKAAKSFQQAVNSKKVPFQTSTEAKVYRPAQTEAEADFLFSSGNNRKDF